MKKIILSLYLVGIAFFYGYSQMSLTLSDSLGSLPNDTTIVKTGIVKTGDTLAELISFFFVKNNSTNLIHVKVKKVELSLLHGTEVYFCWGACYASFVFISPTPVDIAKGVTDSSSFSGHYRPHVTMGISTIRYVFFDQDNPVDSVCVNVKYDAQPLGIENNLPKGTSIVNACPNPANNSASFEYRLSGVRSGSVIVRNVLGSVVKKVDLDNPEGKIALNTSDLDNGMYFYSLVENGISTSTKKLIVKH
jgi:hypothetical protein